MTDQNTRPTPSSDVEQLIENAIRFANWAAGEGIRPIDEAVAGPEDFLFAYSEATGDEEWDTLAERIAALSRLSPPAQVVKPLEWKPFTERADDLEARSIVGRYAIRPSLARIRYRLFSPARCECALYTTIDDAKAAAQADYERRIRSALIDAPAQVEVTDEMVERAWKAASESMIGPDPDPIEIRAALTAALNATDAKPIYPKTIDCRSPVEHAIVEYHLVDNLAGEAEKMGRHSAIRGMMVRLGMYDEFVRALEAGDDYEPPLQDAKPVVPAEPVAFLVDDFHVARQPVKAKGIGPEPTEFLYPASRADHAKETARIMGGTLTPLYAAPPSPVEGDSLKALKLHVAYEALPQDRGGPNGPKGKAWREFIAARDAALASGGKTDA